MFDEWTEIFKENTKKNHRRHDSAIKGLKDNVSRLAQAVRTHNNLNRDKHLDIKSSIIISPLSVNSNLPHGKSLVEQEFVKKGEEDGSPLEAPAKELRTFSEKDNKVPIILGRPMLATAHASIAVFGRKIFLEVTEEIKESEGLEEFLMNDDINGDLEYFLEENDLLPKIKWDTLEELAYAGNNFVGMAKNLHVFIGCHTFLIDFIVLEDISEFVEKGSTEVQFGKAFKDRVGLEIDVTEGILWFKIGKDKTIFNMPQAFNKFSKLPTAHHNKMAHVLRTSDEDKERGIYNPY
uniref:Homeodomain-like protein n=1 Tax=Tanacetum cinerariifolium TaxID=118510 RepID=A0A6L2LAP5_TANCI|nr:homeodomain-like protein [Tanacetum cinerariifolium]